MPLINIIVILVVIGVGLWAVNSFIPMAKPIKTILNAVVVVFVCLWLLQTFGFIDGIRGLRMR